MGTRGFVGFVVDQDEKIAYNHFDSYPSAVGVDVLTWLCQADRDAAADLARHLRVVDPETRPTAEDIARLVEWADVGVGDQSVEDWYCLLRKTQGEPGAMLQAGVIEDAGQFPTDSLFAEWGYLIDFDSGVLEVYRGFQQQPHTRGRFANRAGDHGYQPVALVASWPLDELPNQHQFLSATDPSDDD